MRELTTKLLIFAVVASTSLHSQSSPSRATFTLPNGFGTNLGQGSWQAVQASQHTNTALGTDRIRDGIAGIAPYPKSLGKAAKTSVRRFAVTNLTFRDGTIANFSVGAPWWSWLWLGLIYQPARGNLTTYKHVQKPVREWWCLWLCKETQTVDQPVNAELIVQALGFTANDSGEQITDQGSDSCKSCSSVTHYVHNFGFPAPPWAGGGGFKGIGFHAAPAYQDQELSLHDHWGTDKTTLGAPAFPPDFD